MFHRSKSFCGHETFANLRDIIDSETLQEITYINLLAKAKAYFEPDSSKIEEQFKF